MSQNTSQLPEMGFSKVEDKFLIRFVKKHAILYDLKDPGYKNIMKEDEWNKVGEALSKEGSVCLQRWKIISDNYKRVKKEEKATTGKGDTKKRAIYWQLLQFLDTKRGERSSFTNVLTPSNNELDEYEENDPTEHSSWLGSSHQSQTENTAQSSSQLTQTGTPPLSQSSDSDVFRRLNSQTSKAIVVLPQRQQDSEHFTRFLGDHMNHPGLQKNENEIDMFFRTMAATVKKFRPDLATQTKVSVFNVVTEMEMFNQQSYFPQFTEFTNIQYNENQTFLPCITPQLYLTDASSDIVSQTSKTEDDE